jgi:membrane fusion protein, multidrug efflux system
MNEVFKPDVADRAAPAPEAPPRALPEPEAPPPQQRPARLRRFVGRAALILALAAALVFAWERFENREPGTTDRTTKAERSATPPQTVRVLPVTTGQMPITIDALGTVTPFETVTIRTQIAGKLLDVGFAEGQMVKRGDFIAQIDPLPYRAALAQAQGQLAKDQALLAQAQGDFARYEALSKQDSISKQQVTDQEQLVAQDKAAIATDQAQVQTAQINLDYTHIVSPITGRAGLRLVDPGNYLQPSDATGIVVITQIDPISVIFSTPEDNLPRIAARLNTGAKLDVTVFDRANVNQLATGTLSTYDSQVDVTTGTIRMRATFDNPNGVLFPNQFVNVRLLVDTLTGVALAPNAAIQVGPSGNFVYLLGADSTVSKRDVVTGASAAGQTTITSGLAAGDRVVIDGVDRLRDGAKVTLADATANNGVAAGPARGAGGDQGSCAAGLSTEAKAIYDAAAPEFAASTDPRALIKAKVTDLVKAGAVRQDSARASAKAAGDCLRQGSPTSASTSAHGAAQ